MPAKPRTRQRVSPAACVLSASLIAILWVLFVGGTRRDEMIVGVGVLLLSSAFLQLVLRNETMRVDFGWRDLATCRYIPGSLMARNVQITGILAKDLLGRRAGSYYRFSGFRTGKSDPRLVARHVLAIAYTTLAPNFIVIGIDYHQSRLLFHQLERSAVPDLTKELGAQPGAERT